jgi:hypothetical protein
MIENMILETSSRRLQNRQPRFSVIFDIKTQNFRYREYKLPVRKPKVFMITIRVGAFDTCYPL